MTPVLLAGDVGGTKTDFGLFSAERGAASPLATARVPTAGHASLADGVRTFLRNTGMQARYACFAVAGPVIDGQMYGALFARVAMRWAGPRGFITGMSLRMKSIAFAGDTLRAEGAVTATEAGVVVLSQRMLNAGRVCAEATTRVRLNASG